MKSIDENKIYYLPLTLCVISFVMFGIIYIQLTEYSIIPRYLEGLLFVIPSLIFLLLTILSYKKIIGNITTSLLTISSMLISMGVSFYYFIDISFSNSETPITDIKEYDSVLKYVSNNNKNVSKYFPDTLSKDDSLYYQSGFMQGGEYFMVSSFENNDILNHKVKELEHETLMNDEYSKIGISEEFIYESLLLSNVDINDYKLYLIEAKPYKENDYNHGTYTLILINTTNNHSIYLYESW